MKFESRVTSGAISGKIVGVAINDQGAVLFEAQAIAYLLGYTKKSGLDHHAKDYYRYLNNSSYLTVSRLGKIIKKMRNPKQHKWVHDWALAIQKQEVTKVEVAKAEPVKHPWPFPNYASADTVGITGAAYQLSMGVKEFSDWLVSEGYATRYNNGILKWSAWFNDQKYGVLRVLDDDKGTRTSNVPMITSKGMEFIRNRLSSQREESVLAFAKIESNNRIKQESDELEAEFDKQVLKAFKPFRTDSYYEIAFGNLYEMDQTDLLKTVKAIVAKVKVKR